MDILAVREATKWAKDWVTSGKGPLLMEFVTYRYGGHSMSDPGTTYRTREEVQQMRSSQDAIAGLKKYILEWGVTDEASLKAIDKSAKEEVDAAVEEAKKSPVPDQVEFWSDIYVRATPLPLFLSHALPTDIAFSFSYVTLSQYKGSEPTHMRGREKEEVHYYNKSA